MKTNRSSRVRSSRQQKGRGSISPTLASSCSEKSVWARSYKNEPFPGELRRRLVGRRFNFEGFSDEEQDNSGVVVEEQQQECLQKKKRMLPHFQIISDHGEFIGHRSRIKSQKKFDYSHQRCRSVESLRLPQVVQQKREQDEQHKVQRSKLAQFKDQNQFNRKKHNLSSPSEHSRDSLQLNYFASTVPEKIVQNDAEQTKSQNLHNQKSILTTQLQKLIVDEIDQKKRRSQQTNIESIIEQQRNESQIDTIDRLRISLDKLQSQAIYLTQHRDEICTSSKNIEESTGFQPSPTLDKVNDKGKRNMKVKCEHVKLIHESGME